MDFDSFRIIIDLMDNIVKNKMYLRSLSHEYYSDAFLNINAQEIIINEIKKIYLNSGDKK